MLSECTVHLSTPVNPVWSTCCREGPPVSASWTFLCLKWDRVEEVWGMDNFHLCADYLEVDVIAEGDNSITLQTLYSATVHELSILGYDR